MKKTLWLTLLALGFGICNTLISDKCDEIKLQEAVADEVKKQIEESK